MKVTIPSRQDHMGIYEVTAEISDKCPKCGAKRGSKIWNGFSFDGSRRLAVTQWENECGHTDTYEAVRKEIAENYQY